MHFTVSQVNNTLFPEPTTASGGDLFHLEREELTFTLGCEQTGHPNCKRDSGSNQGEAVGNG